MTKDALTLTPEAVENPLLRNVLRVREGFEAFDRGVRKQIGDQGAVSLRADALAPMLRHQSHAELGAYAGRASTGNEAPGGDTSHIIVGGNQQNPGLAAEQPVLVPSLAEPGSGGVAGPLELADSGRVDVQPI
jgi:hypothetical protein